MIDWTPALSVGVEALDEDHKVIIKCLQNYIKAVDNDAGTLAIDSIFRELIAYTGYHFTREEAVMEACGFPDLPKHKEMHKTIRRDLKEHCQSYMLNPNKQLTDKVRDFLRSWLFNHIYQEDFAYRATLEGKDDLIARALAKADAREG